MGRRWPENGTWVVVPTSPAADWALAAAVLAAAASARVAVIVVGAAAPPPEWPLTHVATWAELHDGGTEPLRLADALRVVDAFSGTHDLVLAVGPAGLTAPAGRVGWTTADLAAALGAPGVVVVGDDPRGVNYTTVEALESRGLASALVTIGTAPENLPAPPSGRIPAGLRELDAETARGFLDAHLHAGPGPVRHGLENAPPPPVTPWPDRGQWMVLPVPSTVDWKPAVTALAAASTARVAVVAIGASGPPAAHPAAHLATWVTLREGGRHPLRRPDAVRVCDALARTHGVVFVLGAAAPAGWSLTYLAAALGAPTVLVTGTADVTDARGAIEGHGLLTAVVAVGDVALAEPPAGRVPADAGELTAEAARELLHPMLHASRAPVPPPTPVRRRRPAAPRTIRPAVPPKARTSGTRIALLLLSAFVVMSLSVVGLAFCNRTAAPDTGAAFDAPPPPSSAPPGPG